MLKIFPWLLTIGCEKTCGPSKINDFVEKLEDFLKHHFEVQNLLFLCIIHWKISSSILKRYLRKLYHPPKIAAGILKCLEKEVCVCYTLLTYYKWICKLIENSIFVAPHILYLELFYLKVSSSKKPYTH